jgi:hypothetical protein
MLDDNQTALARVQSALVNAEHIYNEEKRRLGRTTAACKQTQTDNEALGLLEAYLAILQRHRDNLFAVAARKHDHKR